MFEEITVGAFDKRQKAEDALRTLERDGIAIVVKYEGSYSPGKYLLIVRGSSEDVSRARAISDKTGIAVAA